MEVRDFKIVSPNITHTVEEVYSRPEDAWNELRLKLIEEYAIDAGLDTGGVACLTTAILYVREELFFHSEKYISYWKPVYKDTLNNSYQKLVPIEELQVLKI